MTNARPRIAIIGGGYAGIAAAVRVVERGGVPVVFEAGRVLGGRARRITYKDRALDNGQHILSGAYRELLRLMDVVGVSAQVIERVPLNLSMPPYFQLRAPLLPAPLHMAVALLRAKGLSWHDRFRAILMMQALKKSQFNVDARLTVAQLLAAHRQPPRVIEYLWQPLTISALNTPIHTASAQVLANVLRDALAGAREASDLLLPKTDLSALFPEPAAAWITTRGGEIRLGNTVKRIVIHDDSVEIHAEDGQAESEPAHYTAAILAVGPHQRNAVPIAFSGKNASNSSPLLEFENNSMHQYESITTLYFGFDKVPALAAAMFGQPRGLAQWFFDRRQLSNTPDTGELVVAAVISARGAHDDMDNATLAARVFDELKAFAPTLPAPTWQKVIREKFATFACTPVAPRPSHLTDSKRFYLAGDDIGQPSLGAGGLYPATLEGAARNGVAAANAALDFLTPAI